MSGLARWQWLAFCIHYPDLDAVQRPATRQQALGVEIGMLFGSEIRDCPTGFGQSIDLGEAAFEHNERISQ
jgi:hypothetical protein